MYSCPGRVVQDNQLRSFLKTQLSRATSCAAFIKSSCLRQVAQLLKKIVAQDNQLRGLSNQYVVVQTTGLWKRIFVCTCGQELTQSLVTSGMTRTAGVSVMVGVGFFVLFVCVPGGFNPCGIPGIHSWHIRVNNRPNHVRNKLRGMATINWYAGLARRSAVNCTYHIRARFGCRR